MPNFVEISLNKDCFENVSLINNWSVTKDESLMMVFSYLSILREDVE
jgi:hypothetical protein